MPGRAASSGPPAPRPARPGPGVSHPLALAPAPAAGYMPGWPRHSPRRAGRGGAGGRAGGRAGATGGTGAAGRGARPRPGGPGGPGGGTHPLLGTPRWAHSSLSLWRAASSFHLLLRRRRTFLLDDAKGHPHTGGWERACRPTQPTRNHRAVERSSGAAGCVPRSTSHILPPGGAGRKRAATSKVLQEKEREREMRLHRRTARAASTAGPPSPRTNRWRGRAPK